MNEVTSTKSWVDLADDEIDLSDIPELGEEFFKHAKMRGPLVQKNTVLVDTDIYQWFQEHSPDYQQRINQLLRDYMDVQKNSG
jgi:uncharacterized protein (DUF4415 family)